MTGKTPGQLGIYGFRNRKDTTYDGLSIATSDAVKEPAVWDKLGERGMRSMLIGVPPSFPPPKEFPGWRVGCFLTPPRAKSFAYPQRARDRDRRGARRTGTTTSSTSRTSASRDGLRARPGLQDDRAPVPGRPTPRREQALGLLHDVRDRAGPAPPRVLAVLRPDAIRCTSRATSTRRRSRTTTGSSTRGRHAPGAASRGRDHDRHERPRRPPDDGRPVLQRLADPGGLPRDDASRSRGPMPIKDAPIDWSRTVAWGDGGYYGRLFLNVKGREPQGIVEPAEYEAIRDELIAKLEADARPRRRAARHEGAQAAGRVHGGPRRRARPDRVLRRSGVALGGLGRQPAACTPTRTTPAPTGRTTTGRACSRWRAFPASRRARSRA